MFKLPVHSSVSINSLHKGKEVCLKTDFNKLNKLSYKLINNINSRSDLVDIRQNFFNTAVYFNRANRLPVNTQIVTDNKLWEVKFTLLVVTYQNFEFAGRFRHRIIKSLFNLIFFENTISLKNLFFFWIKVTPLQIHKKLIVTLTENMIFIQFFNYLFFIKFKLLFCLKGKLGLRGDNKKKKNIYQFNSDFRYKIGTGLNYDGIGSASRFGLTFFKIMYTQTDFNEFQFYDYIPE